MSLFLPFSQTIWSSHKAKCLLSVGLSFHAVPSHFFLSHGVPQSCRSFPRTWPFFPCNVVCHCRISPKFFQSVVFLNLFNASFPVGRLLPVLFALPFWFPAQCFFQIFLFMYHVYPPSFPALDLMTNFHFFPSSGCCILFVPHFFPCCGTAVNTFFPVLC